LPLLNGYLANIVPATKWDIIPCVIFLNVTLGTNYLVLKILAK
jgi:hypothetical protein